MAENQDITIDDIIKKLTEIKQVHGNLTVVSQDGDDNVFPATVGVQVLNNMHYNEMGYYVQDESKMVGQDVVHIGWMC